MMITPEEFAHAEWRPAIYNGRPIKNLLVSNLGQMRRIVNGVPSQVSNGTPSFNKKSKNRLRQMMVSIAFGDVVEGTKAHTTVNLHRVVLCTFKGVIFEKGMDVDHLDRDVSNGRLENLRACTHTKNMENRGMIRRDKCRCKVASDYGWRMRIQLGCRRLDDLPRAYRNEYARLIRCEKLGLPAVPRPINATVRKK